jgi:hypothetical protein
MPSKALVLVSLLAVAGAIVSGGRANAQVIYPYPPYRPAVLDSSVRIEATPRDAEVFVDGYYAGIVDDFDGIWQRLRVEPGPHEIVLYAEGYRAFHQRVYLARDRTFRIKAQLEPLAPGEIGEGRPVATPPPVGVQPPRQLPRGPIERGPAAPADQAGPATLTIHVEPADAEVLVDGQPFSRSAGQDSVTIDVAAGRHVVQVRKAGYVGYLTEITLRQGETRRIEVALRPQP